jgi:hypothetical protein
MLGRWLRGRYPDRPYKMPFELVARPSSEKVYQFVNNLSIKSFLENDVLTTDVAPVTILERVLVFVHKVQVHTSAGIACRY